MKKAIVALAAVGAIIGLRPLAKRLGEQMRQHCAQMAAHCAQMPGYAKGRGEAIGRM